MFSFISLIRLLPLFFGDMDGLRLFISEVGLEAYARGGESMGTPCMSKLGVALDFLEWYSLLMSGEYVMFYSVIVFWAVAYS